MIFIEKGNEIMRVFIIAILMSALLMSVSACTTVKPTVYMPDDMRTIETWGLEFAYEAGSVEQLQKSSGDSELKVVNKGQLPVDLLLRDDIYYALKDEHAIPMVKTPSITSGRIQIHPIHFYSGGFKTLAVTFVNGKGEIIARMKVENGDRKMTFLNDDKFAQYSAKIIADAIRESGSEK